MLVLRILVGIALLLLGRKLFWLFVGGIGFIVAMDLTLRLLPQSAPLVAIVVGLLVGVIGALLAVFIQEAAVGVAGFLAGGAIVLSLIDLLGMGEMTVLAWVLVVVGAVIGLALTLALLEWALIVLSSLSGAGLVAQAIDVTPPLALVVFAVALVVGIIVQARVLQREAV